MNCVRCGAEIDSERLEFLPDVRTCVACSRTPAKQVVCDPADGEVLILDDSEAARPARTIWSIGCTGRTLVCRRSVRTLVSVAAGDHADAVL